MLKNRTVVALGLLVIVAAATVWMKTRKDPHAALLDKPTPYAVNKADVDEIEIAEPGKPAVQLKKDGAEWKLVQPVADKADPQSVEQAVDALAELKLKDVIAESPESYEKVGMKDDEVVKVTPKKAGKPLATLLLGKTSNVRLDGDKNVWSTSNLKRWALVKEPKAWRDRQVLSFPMDQIDRVEVAYAAGKVTARREAPPAPPPAADGKTPPPPPPTGGGPDKWTLTEGQDLLGGGLDENVPLELSSTLARLSADDVVDSPTADKTGLEAPRATVTVYLKDGKSHTLLVGKDEGQSAYVKLKDGARVWKVQKFESDRIPTSPAQWRDKTVATMEPSQVQKIELTKDGEKDKIVLDRVDDKTFKATSPASLGELDQMRVQAILRSIQQLKATKVLDGDAKANGLDKPYATATLSKKDGKTVKLLVGKENKEKDSETAFMIAGAKDVYAAPGYVVSPFVKTAAELKKQAAPPAPPPGGM